MNTKNTRGLTSIIVPCWNQLEFTRQCIRALKTHTRPPWELIVIDNGSTDHTADLPGGRAGWGGRAGDGDPNTTNRGFPAAINQGLKVARGDYLVLLNNDVVVTDSWLEQLVALANMGTENREARRRGGRWLRVTRLPRSPCHSEACVTTPPGRLDAEACVTTPPGPPLATGGRRSHAGGIYGFGLVGPMSNYAIAAAVGRERALSRHAGPCTRLPGSGATNIAGSGSPTHKLSGFCLLMKRAVYETIGGLDERFGIGFFDDDDLAERARRAGFELAVAHDLFVHHFGSRTFQGNGIDAEKLLDENARRFADKWGLEKANGKRVALRPWPDFLAESQREFARQVDEPETARQIRIASRTARRRRLARSRSALDDDCP